MTGTTIINGSHPPSASASPPATPLQRRSAVRRERRRLSDPAVPKINVKSVAVSFHDTTALRHRANRNDTRTLFGDSEPNGASALARPKDPPPPPPPSSSAPSSPSVTKMPSRALRGDANESAPPSPNIDYEEISFGPNATEMNAVPCAPQRKRIQATNEAIQGSRLFGVGQSSKQSDAPKGASMLTLKMAPLVLNRDASAVHRLQIRNEDPAAVSTCDPYDSTPKKTSIMISGDDCYSTVNVSSDSQPMYHASVVVNGGDASPAIVKSSSNTVSINVTTPVEADSGLLALLAGVSSNRSIIPIPDAAAPYANQSRTLITVDYAEPTATTPTAIVPKSGGIEIKDVISNDQELLKMLRSPLSIDGSAQMPHVCGRHSNTGTLEPVPKKSPDTRKTTIALSPVAALVGSLDGRSDSFISKLLEDPTLGHLAEGLDNDIVAKLIENSLIRLKETRSGTDLSGTKDEHDMNRLIEMSLLRVKEERLRLATATATAVKVAAPASSPSVDELLVELRSNRDSMSSANSFSSANYEAFDFDTNELSDCYQSCSSELTVDEDSGQAVVTRSKFYQMLVDATLSEIEITTTALDDQARHDRVGNGGGVDDDDNDDDDHHYESIRLNGDPIYEEINDMPPPLPLCPPPLNDADADKKLCKSMFEGASKYDILSYLVDAKERGLVAEDTYTYNFSNTSDTIIIEEDTSATSTAVSAAASTPDGGRKLVGDKTVERLQNRRNAAVCNNEPGSRISQASSTALSDDASITNDNDEISALKLIAERKSSSDIERNDSGVGSETSKNSRSKYQSTVAAVIGGSLLHKNSPIHLCEDCDGPVETQITESGVMFAPLVCRKCGKKRAERKEIVTEIIETEEKYGRDLQIILEEFYQPMLVAGLLTQEQLSTIFLNAEELLENSQSLADKMRDAFDIALEQGDEDLLTVNIGRLMLDAAPMLHAFESYCVRQAAASLLLANMEKEKELLRIFLRVSQMENTVLRRMNLNSFLMVGCE